ncbi:hypothetical protein [Kosakonia oryziphila]|uniref:Uncharacterized protein n=1 Tax=Kosakonia oryziphila TaxID=1005667 RepID=A0A1C4EMR4_9ENTR|nr:hypothetical protein [Kosakonia oryziphila]SCC44868.1 hypothetical protein GA0061070_10253 [Kosakonia oryziphila]
MSAIVKWGTRFVAFCVLSYLVALSGSLRPLVNNIYIPFTDFLTQLGLGEMRDYGERLDNNLIILYFFFSAVVAVLLIFCAEWSVKQIRKK